MSGVCNQSASIMEQEAGCTRPRSSCSKKSKMEIRKKKLQQDLMLLALKKKNNHIAQPAASIQLVMFFKLIGNHKVLEQMLIFLKGLTVFSSVFKHFSGISMKVWCWRDAKL